MAKDIINCINPDIQFTFEFSKTELPFLDTCILIKKVDSTKEVDIYHKPADSKQYSLFHSCHPKHVTKNVPYNLANRICTMVKMIE